MVLRKCPAGCAPDKDDEAPAPVLLPQSQPPAEQIDYEELFAILEQGFPAEGEADAGCRTKGAQDEPCSSASHQEQLSAQPKEPSATNEGGAFVHNGLPPDTPAAKRPRLDGIKALVRSKSSLDDYDGPPPPDEVAEAYALLNLPLSALRSDVQRQSRVLARERHPDKAPPDQRVRATRLFRQLQDAKEKILSWLRQRTVPQLDESDDSPCLDSADEAEEEQWRPPEVVFGEAGDVLADFEQDGSGSDLEKADQKAACVYRGRGDSPDTASSSEESGEEKAETALALRSRGIIRTEDSALVQATALSHFMASQKRRPQEMCSECFQRKVSKGSDLCSECYEEMRQLRRCLKA